MLAELIQVYLSCLTKCLSLLMIHRRLLDLHQTLLIGLYIFDANGSGNISAKVLMAEETNLSI